MPSPAENNPGINPESFSAKKAQYRADDINLADLKCFEGRDVREFRREAEDIIGSLNVNEEERLGAQLQMELTFDDYLAVVRANPEVTRSAFERAYDMIMSYGTYTDEKTGRLQYRFFDDPDNNGDNAIFGLDETKQKIVNFLEAGAKRYGAEKRFLLLKGPVGSSKSTIATLLKRGLESYTRSDEGALYMLGVPDYNEKDAKGNPTIRWAPMHDEPLLAIPKSLRKEFLTKLNAGKSEDDYQVNVRGGLNPESKFYFNELKKHHNGDLRKSLSDLRVKRFVFSEKDRVGIGTFQPKDEKNQDSTELTGDINYRKIAEYGSDSDPRAFNFDGEFNIANRGVVEFVEVLKLDVAFLYDLLGATQEKSIKPKKFAQTDIDELIIGHTNEPEYEKLRNNEFMEAFRDRTVRVNVPYLTNLSEEIKIYEKDYNNKRVKDKFIAPHTLEIAAMFAVLSRLEEPASPNLTLLQKMKLYDGKEMKDWTEENVKELRDGATNEGNAGVSPRFIQDRISDALVNHPHATSLSPFMVLNEIKAGLKNFQHKVSEERMAAYNELIDEVVEEYKRIVKDEVQKAISADEESLKRLCSNYIDNVKAYTQRERVKNPFTGASEEPDERLMRSIEDKIEVTESRKDDFRREIMNYIAAKSLEGKPFRYQDNERLAKALQEKLFEDQKDTIKLTSMISNVVDKDTQAKIDVVKQRLIDRFGYNEETATDVLHYAASIFARGAEKRK